MTAADSAIAHAERRPEATRRREMVWQDPVASTVEAAGRSGLEYMKAIAAGQVPPPPIAVLMNMHPVEVEEGRAVFEGTPGEEHYNPIAVVHGGYASTLLDSVLGVAVHTTLPAGAAYTTQSLEVKFLRPITRETGLVRAEGVVVHRGSRQAVAEGRLVAAESEKMLATATATLMILGEPSEAFEWGPTRPQRAASPTRPTAGRRSR
ncbi:MAG TPA: PaaI family thioesterase [Solirubrobacterales bacterium]|nr:PaaI family thioesterase [Solirubrobacterales bacterium]